MSKKSTDASSILGAARRSAEVPRPQAEASALPETPTPPERRVNVALKAPTHKRLKLLAVQRDTTVQELAEQMLVAALDAQERRTT
ncbi:hypothetical protein GCM10010840_34270 [Deinococcus aerolatus]|uniref:Chromosome partitioning protein ParB n=1 Tax=Deinococcus aerolatus TaxID=522487 RepID=A0ABQ2GF42_9DEIO|nr:hypothetical protein [Deinococcus aerolatus]GGL93388.1 hypothetical protein GCM10010840_34270 [Deinococcus aerolatus]